MNSTPIFVIGSSGYISSLIVGILKTEFHVDPRVIKSKDAPSVLRRELPNKAIVFNATGVTHCPPEFYGQEQQVFFNDSNVYYLQEVLGEISLHNAKFIHISSSLVEESDLLAQSPYLKSKLAAEEYLLRCFENNRDKLQIIRLPSIWSKKRLKKNSLLSFLIENQNSCKIEGLSNPHRICHISTDKYIRVALESALNRVDFEILQNKNEVLKTTANQLAEFLCLDSCQACKTVMDKETENHLLESLFDVYKYWIHFHQNRLNESYYSEHFEREY